MTPATRRPWVAIAAAWLCAIGAMLWVGSAAAYCREVSVGPPGNYDPAVRGCFGVAADGGLITAKKAEDGGLLTGPDGRLVTTSADAGVTLFPLFWRNQCFSYSFQRKGSKYIAASDAARVAARAFDTWSHAACPGGSPNIVADPYPVVDCDDLPSQAHNNVIIFRDDAWPYDDAENAIGYTTLTVSTRTGEIFGADIEINTFGFTIVADLSAVADDAGDVDAGDNVLDLGTILTHETGHFLGLAHSANPSAVMFAHYMPGTTNLTPDDVAGICSIYPADGTRVTGEGPILAGTCNPAPPLGFLTTCGSLDSGVLGMAAVGSGASPNPSSATTPCPPTCAMGRAPGGGGSGIGGLGVFALVALSVLGRRAGRALRRPRLIGLSAAAALAASVMIPREARASVSATVLFAQLVEESSAVAVVIPTEQRTLWEGNRIATYTHVRVDRLLAGQLPQDAWIRTLGGEVGDLAQIVEGQASFPLARPSLVFLRAHADPVTRQPTDAFVVVERAQGQFPVVVGAGGQPRLALSADVGVLLSLAPGARTAHIRSAKDDPRFARDVLRDRSLEDAMREIAAIWTRTHPTPSP